MMRRMYRQLYETTISDVGRRLGGGAAPSFTFVVVPQRSLLKEHQQDLRGTVRSFELSGPPIPRPSGETGPILLEPFDPSLLFYLVDLVLGDRRMPWQLLEGLDSASADPEALRFLVHGGGHFTRYLTHEPVVPFESSPVSGKALSDIAQAGSGVGAAVGAYATGDPLLLLLVPAGIVICGAARGMSQALEIGLRAKLLRAMGIEGPDLRLDAQGQLAEKSDSR